MENLEFTPKELINRLSAELVFEDTLQYPPKLDVLSTESIVEHSDSDIVLNNSVNISLGLEPELWLRHSVGITAVYCFAYSIVFVLGIAGNSFVVAVVLQSPRMRTVTNYFIANLALADILVLIFCLPATLLSNIFVPWLLGCFMCKAVSYLQGVSVSASINTLVAISVDRYFAICYPLKCQLSTRMARRIIALIWLFSLIITLPWALYFQAVQLDDSHPEVVFCHEIWPQEKQGTAYFLGANLGLCYLIPLVIISACYTAIWVKVWRRIIPGETKGTNLDQVVQKSKLKVVKMLLIVVVLFMISWLPLYIIFTRIKLGGPMEQGSLEEEIITAVIPIAQWLGSSNSCVNPVLYAFFNNKFRRGFLAILKSRKCCDTLHYDTGSEITRSTVIRSTYKSRYDRPSQCGSSAAEV